MRERRCDGAILACLAYQPHGSIINNILEGEMLWNFLGMVKCEEMKLGRR